MNDLDQLGRICETSPVWGILLQPLEPKSGTIRAKHWDLKDPETGRLRGWQEAPLPVSNLEEKKFNIIKKEINCAGKNMVTVSNQWRDCPAHPETEKK